MLNIVITNVKINAHVDADIDVDMAAGHLFSAFEDNPGEPHDIKKRPKTHKRARKR